MRTSPHYGDSPVLRLTVELPDPPSVVMRQRRRLGTILQGLDAHQWGSMSRCEGWTVKDVVAHLTTTNQYWAYSISQGRLGAPTRLLDGFDPVSGPAELVSSSAAVGFEQVLEQFLTTTEAMEQAMQGDGSIDDSTLAEAPLIGHVWVGAVELHALWDSWIHERDIVTSLGLTAHEERDELLACLTYASALGPAILAAMGSQHTGSLHVTAPDVGADFVVEMGPNVTVRDAAASESVALSGDAVELIEGLSCRGAGVTLAPDHQWMVEGISIAFQ